MISEWLEERIQDFLMEVFHAGVIVSLGLKTEKRNGRDVATIQYALMKIGSSTKLYIADVKLEYQKGSLRKIEAELREPTPEEATDAKKIFWDLEKEVSSDG